MGQQNHSVTTWHGAQAGSGSVCKEGVTTVQEHPPHTHPSSIQPVTTKHYLAVESPDDHLSVAQSPPTSTPQQTEEDMMSPLYQCVAICLRTEHVCGMSWNELTCTEISQHIQTHSRANGMRHH
ncbi:unnamed protein product [Arctogadus glacialis]